MSRWADQFETHAYKSTWADLKTQLENSTVDDSTVITSVTELARLKKVTSYIDGMLNNIDPELVPLTTWDTFNQQALACSQQISAYNSNRNIAHIQNANTNADNLLTYVRPYMVKSGKIGNVLQEAIKSYANTINEYAESFRKKSGELLEEIEKNSTKGNTLLEVSENIANKIGNYQITLFGEENSDGGIQETINSFVADFKKKNEEISIFYDETLVGDQKSPSTKSEITQAKKDILASQEQLSDLLTSASAELEELESFYNKIYGKLNSENERRGGLAQELDERVTVLNDFEKKQSAKYTALNNQIEGLLPGATSAGLASAYHEMRNTFTDPIKYMSQLFYAAIGLLVFASVLLAIDNIGLYYINFIKIGEWDSVLKSIVNKIPFYAPILWLAFYASKRRSEYQRLQQEYAHKEALAKSYDNYKKQIEQLDDKDKEMQKSFIMKAIDAVAYNASTTLDGNHGDKMPGFEVLEKILVELTKHQKGVS